LEEARLDFEGPMPDFTWMVDGTGPPKDLSVYVFNADLAIVLEEFRLVVPAVVNNDDGTYAYCHTVSLATPGICVIVVSYPVDVHDRGFTLDRVQLRARGNCRKGWFGEREEALQDSIRPVEEGIFVQRFWSQVVLSH
jgi:hypothetical protein